MSQKFLLGAVCAGLMLNSLISEGRSFAEGAVASIPQEMFMTKDELLQLCEGKTGKNSLLATGTDTDKKIRINFGIRPEVVKYYSDYVNTAHEVAAGPMTWLLVGYDEAQNSGKPGLVLYSEKPMISPNELKYPGNSNSEPTQGGTNSRFQLNSKMRQKYEGFPPLGRWYVTTDDGNTIFKDEWGIYLGEKPIKVFANHWGASNLRAQLKKLFDEDDRFTKSEKTYMLPSSVTTTDIKNSVNYETTDILYALSSPENSYGENSTKITAGEADNMVIDKLHWAGYSWLRSPSIVPSHDDSHAFATYCNLGYISDCTVNTDSEACAAAFKLDVQPFSFLSAAECSAITRSGEAFSQIAADTPMTLRIDGSSQDMGTAMFSEDKTSVIVQNAQGATLMVQGVTASGENWNYSKNITLDSDTITTEVISNANAAATAPDNVPDLALVNFENCKVWLEKPTETGSTLSYAVMATDFVSPEEPETPGNPAEAPDKDNQNGAAADQETPLDIAKTGDKVTCFAISALSLAAALSFGALLSSKISKRKSN